MVQVAAEAELVVEVAVEVAVAVEAVVVKAAGAQRVAGQRAVPRALPDGAEHPERRPSILWATTLRRGIIRAVSRA